MIFTSTFPRFGEDHCTVLTWILPIIHFPPPLFFYFSSEIRLLFVANAWFVFIQAWRSKECKLVRWLDRTAKFVSVNLYKIQMILNYCCISNLVLQFCIRFYTAMSFSASTENVKQSHHLNSETQQMHPINKLDIFFTYTANIFWIILLF
jgi:hypothetical protein